MLIVIFLGKKIVIYNLVIISNTKKSQKIKEKNINSHYKSLIKG